MAKTLPTFACVFTAFLLPFLALDAAFHLCFRSGVGGRTSARPKARLYALSSVRVESRFLVAARSAIRIRVVQSGALVVATDRSLGGPGVQLRVRATLPGGLKIDAAVPAGQSVRIPFGLGGKRPAIPYASCNFDPSDRFFRSSEARGSFVRSAGHGGRRGADHAGCAGRAGRAVLDHQTAPVHAPPAVLWTC